MCAHTPEHTVLTFLAGVTRKRLTPTPGSSCDIWSHLVRIVQSGWGFPAKPNLLPRCMEKGRSLWRNSAFWLDVDDLNKDHKPKLVGVKIMFITSVVEVLPFKN